MKSFWIFFLLQILPAPCYIKLSRTSLEIALQYDFRNLPNLGDVMVWTIAVHSTIFESQIYTKNNIPKFVSDKTYLVLTQSQRRRIRLFYWVGSTASLVEKKNAANYAFHVYLILKQMFGYEAILSISREAEFIKSRSFENTINFVDKVMGTHTAIFLNKCDDEQLPYNVPNLYLVRGTSHTTRVKAVPMSPQWFMYDACLVLETGYNVEGLKPVTKLCGPIANNNTYSTANHVAGVIDLIYIIKNERKPLTGKAMIKAFVDVLENKENYRSHEVDDSNDQLKDAETFVAERDISSSFHAVFQNTLTRTDPRPYETFSQYYHNVSKFRSPGVYLLDSASVAGLFLQLHPYSRVEQKLVGLEISEEYLHNKYTLKSKPIRMRISEIQARGAMPVNLTINMSNFPTFGEH